MKNETGEKMKKPFLVVFSTVIVSTWLFSCFSSGFVNIVLTNKSVIPITELYFGNAEAVEKSGTTLMGPDYWRSNLLEEPLNQRYSYITQTLAATFDIRIVDEEGREKIFDNVAVAKDQTVTIECLGANTYTLNVE
jgi:hypothetical protein